MLPARLGDYEREGDPHYYGIGNAAAQRPRPPTSMLRPRDIGAQGDQWRAILLDQFRRRGVNFFGT